MELLVVAAVISILVGIFIPTVNLVRQWANTTKCSSNVRQLYLCAMSYTRDHKNKFPMGYDDDNNHIKTFQKDGILPYIFPHLETEIRTGAWPDSGSSSGKCGPWASTNLFIDSVKSSPLNCPKKEVNFKDNHGAILYDIDRMEYCFSKGMHPEWNTKNDNVKQLSFNPDKAAYTVMTLDFFFEGNPSGVAAGGNGLPVGEEHAWYQDSSRATGPGAHHNTGRKFMDFTVTYSTWIDHGGSPVGFCDGSTRFYKVGEWEMYINGSQIFKGAEIKAPEDDRARWCMRANRPSGFTW